MSSCVQVDAVQVCKGMWHWLCLLQAGPLPSAGWHPLEKESPPTVETEAGDFPMPGFKFPHLRNEVVFLPCLSHEEVR